MKPKIRIRKSEINDRVYLAVYRIYGEYLRTNTYRGRIDSTKAQVMNSWDISKGRFLEYKFRNPNYFQIFMQEEGLEPQIISARNKKFMRFKKPETRKSTYQKIPGNVAFEKDGYIYAKMVRHPGFEGRHFIREMLYDQSLWNEFSNVVVSEIDKLVDQKREEAQQELDKMLENT